MRITVARLRRGILILGGLLAVVLIGFFLYAHYRFRHLAGDLPAKLGVNIQQTASGYTYSQSSGGHTLYTIHASKLIEYKKGGNATLHDVSITLYGPPGSTRVDKIYGSDFSYNPKQQEVSALGTVEIDLQGFGKDSHDGKNAIHVKTSGLVFSQKTGEADTSGHTEFSFPQAAGSSTGARYNSKTGVLVLDSNVELTSTGANPAVVHASHAQIVRDTMQALLLNPRTEYRSEKGSADAAIVGFRDNGSASSVNAKGHVRVVTADGAVITATNALTQLNDKSQPVTTEMTGGVNFESKTPEEIMHGNANEASLTFIGNSELKHATFRNAVSFVDQVLRLANDPNGTASRQIQASKIDVDFVPEHGKNRAVAREVLATGAASVNLNTVPSKGPQQATTISGGQLLAKLTADGKAIRELTGSGGTKITELAKGGSTNTSTGDRLIVTFAQAKSEAASAKTKRISKTARGIEIASAVQDGHVVLTQQPKQGPGPVLPATLTAWAQHAEYQAASGGASDQILHLTGSPRLENGQLQMAADRIDYNRDSGDASAAGAVKATYTETAKSAPMLGGEGPVHITADHAFVKHATNTSTFFGSGGTDARMWQGGDSISAPVLELTRDPATLKAHGRPGATGAVVHANLTSAMGKSGQPTVARISSLTLDYSDKDRRGDFRGGVTARDAAGVIRADEAEVYLTAAKKGAPVPHSSKSGLSGPPSGGKGQGPLERIVATGHVEVTQPGRRGIGEKLVYTAQDGKYVLTGAPGEPPRIVDEAKGTTSGTTLIFNSQNDSVEVSGGQSRAVTETRAPNDTR
ncbi:MAG TPA: LptA/OstA family protein [Acidobacteriaceae bacterium]|nr:LptA/OstA family protein [Acidobacteriaceae bacterium]